MTGGKYLIYFRSTKYPTSTKDRLQLQENAAERLVDNCFDLYWMVELDFLISNYSTSFETNEIQVWGLQEGSVKSPDGTQRALFQ